MKRLLLLIIVSSQCLICLAQKQVVTISSDENGNSWQPFVSKEGRFSVDMPGVPSHTTNERDTSDGKIIFNSFAVKLTEAFYQVGYTDYSASDDAALAREIFSETHDIFSKHGAEILSEREITVANVNGREWWILQSRAAIGIKRIFVLHGRSYQVNMLVSLNRAFKNGRPSLKRDDQTELFASATSRFFDSFKFITPPSPAMKDRPYEVKLVSTGAFLDYQPVRVYRHQRVSATNNLPVAGRI